MSNKRTIHFVYNYHNKNKKDIVVYSHKVITSLGSITRVGYTDKIYLNFKKYKFWLSRGVNFSKHSCVILLFFNKLKSYLLYAKNS